MAQFRTAPGEPFPLGATWDGSGVNFALFSENAHNVELCIFDESGGPERHRVRLREQTDFVWHAYLPDARPGTAYGYRVYGPWDPGNGHRFNHHKLLLDPYAKAITGPIQWSDAMFGHAVGGGDDRDLQMDTRDSASGMPKSVVIESAFSWGNDRPPNIPWHDTIIYEAHVKGLTVRHPGLPEEIRGTYRALCDSGVLSYLRDLGVTAVELMPVQHFLHDKRLLDQGLANYWGYNTVGFFVPEPGYGSVRSPGARVNEFKTMVKTLHNAGLEVIIDVVYNHTAEGNQLGPTLSFRGIDNASYYRLMPDDRRHYMDYTGTGNTLNMHHPRTVQLIMDSLRYWVVEMHVDGFRFDLASALARGLHEVDRLSAFFEIIHQDPVLSRVKLIAEPWDIGEGGYQVGNFPVLWAEWNGKYRDTTRKFWRGDPGQVADLAYRLTGSSDLYEGNGKKPSASVNFVTAHDGFTLADLVSYYEKHNEANGEDNKDGESFNRSWNCGVEGPTTDPDVIELRARQERNFLATLLLSQGVPMLLGGDEMGRTQRGNNNAYCQDNEISWFDWDHQDGELVAFTQRLISLRRSHPVFRRRHFFQGQPLYGEGVTDIAWFRADGSEMTDDDWREGLAKTLGVFLNGAAIPDLDSRGQRVTDDSFLVLFNAHHEAVEFELPDEHFGERWVKLLDTADAFDEGLQVKAGEALLVEDRSLVLLRRGG